MLHSLTSRQNAKYSSSSVQKGRAIHTLQGEGASDCEESWGGAELCTSFRLSQNKQNITF